MNQSTPIDLQTLHNRILALEESVLELRVPFYKKYQLCIRIVTVCILITVIIIGILFGFSTK
jgi:hypothetical protein